MNEIQMRGMEIIRETTKSILTKTISKEEMAQTDRNLDKTGNIASMSNGDVYVWDARFEHWALFMRSSR